MPVPLAQMILRLRTGKYSSMCFVSVLHTPACIAIYVDSNILPMIVVCYGQVYATIRRHIKVVSLSTLRDENSLRL